MTKISAKVIRKRPRYNEYQTRMTKFLKDKINISLNMVRTTVVTGISQGPATGETRRDGSRASKEGEYPMTDTGFLIQNINISVDNDGLGGSVDSNANYSEALEFGTSKMGARPFMQPSLEENKPKIKRLFRTGKIGAT
tara:strand:- start:11 stop:427 length:417 start_codon:yes stop_codon:yes gene_type:complete